MLKILKLTFVFTLISLLIPQNTYAYLDPGSGSYLIQIIIASVAGLGYLTKLNWERIKNIFSKKEKKGAENEKEDNSS